MTIDETNVPVVRIGGVPEHFNYLFKLAEQQGIFKKYGVKVEFVVCACGTGAMIKSLKEKKEVDLIVALTEGLIADIAKDLSKKDSDGGDVIQLLGTYVNSPLCWAISAGKDRNDINDTGDIRNKTFGVSRYGSGSHLMAYVLAMQRGWDPQKDISFKVIGNFQQLRDSCNQKSQDTELNTDVFMWETFTTKPFHDSGEIKRVGDIT